MSYNPDSWVVLKITSPGHGTVYKILAGWYGGYQNGDSWKINSCIIKVEIDPTDNFYLVSGWSGSVYKCNKKLERMSGIMAMIYQNYADKFAEDPEKYGAIEIISMEDYLNTTIDINSNT